MKWFQLPHEKWYQTVCTVTLLLLQVLNLHDATLILMPESNIHSFRVASTSSVIEEAPDKTSKSANRPRDVLASVPGSS